MNSFCSAWLVLVSFGVLSIQTQAFAATAASGGEDWKGKPDASSVTLGLMQGLGFIDSTPGYSLLGTGAFKIGKNGFIPDITNAVWLETEMGAIFFSGTSAFQYSAHLRWDFKKDESWTFFAIGGASGYATASSKAKNDFALTPRFGVGAFYKVTDLFDLRGEISHDLIGLGVSFPMYF